MYVCNQRTIRLLNVLQSPLGEVNSPLSLNLKQITEFYAISVISLTVVGTLTWNMNFSLLGFASFRY